MEIPVGWSPQDADILVVPGGGPPEPDVLEGVEDSEEIPFYSGR